MTRPDPIVPAASQKTYDRFHFAPAVRVGDLVYCSGVIGADGATVPDDPVDEFAAAFDGLAAVLAEAGGSLDDVVEMTSYHVDLSEHFSTFMAAKDAALPEAPYPAWTAIGCTELAIPGARVEIRAIAHLPA